MLGYVVLLTGLFWVPSGSLYTKLYYALTALPALIGLAIAPRKLCMTVREPIIFAFIAIAAWLLISLCWTQTDNSQLKLAKRPLYVFLLFASCALIASKNEQLLLGALRIAAILAGFAALANLLIHLSSNPLTSRMIGTGGLRNPLLSSHVFGFFCTYWVASWLVRNERLAWLPLLLGLPLVTALLATGSRTPLLALTMTCAWMLLMVGKRALYPLTMIALAACSLIILQPDILLERGASFRPQLWSEALRQASEQLWLGQGYDSSFVFKIAGLEYALSDPHNVELAVLLELGLIGLALWLLMHGLALIRCLQLRHERQFQLVSALIVYGLCAGLSEGSNFLSRPNENWFIIWIPLALIAALSIAQRLRATTQ
ncbi:conserved membrane hypothetical protein [Pseudomonas sp. 8AS]|nr:conserved membrane hypothetical protein [Pseudomonas sp. 8AS]